MRRFTCVPLFAVAVACSNGSVTQPSVARSSSIPARAVETNQKDHVDLLLAACNGEAVLMSGENHLILGFTETKSGNVSAFVSADYNLSGIGAVTGARYNATLRIRDQEMASDNVSDFHYRSSLKLVGQGK